jgi:hypothetical protein
VVVPEKSVLIKRMLGRSGIGAPVLCRDMGERLHSFLIYAGLKQNSQQYISDHQHVVVETGDFAPPAI